MDKGLKQKKKKNKKLLHKQAHLSIILLTQTQKFQLINILSTKTSKFINRSALLNLITFNFKQKERKRNKIDPTSYNTLTSLLLSPFRGHQLIKIQWFSSLFFYFPLYRSYLISSNQFLIHDLLCTCCPSFVSYFFIYFFCFSVLIK